MMTSRSRSISDWVERGPADQLAEDLHRSFGLASWHADPVDGGLAVGGRIERPADALDGFADRIRVDGKAAVPLKVRCSRKWAIPACSGASRREPAGTYAAIDTDRAAGSRAEITRGPPSATAVRSNIAGMVARVRGFGPPRLLPALTPDVGATEGGRCAQAPEQRTARAGNDDDDHEQVREHP